MFDSSSVSVIIRTVSHGQFCCCLFIVCCCSHLMWKVYIGPLFYGIVLNVISSFAIMLLIWKELDAILHVIV